jgi:hypothetical protein
MLVSWFVFPLLFLAICHGCGLLLEALAGRPLPRELVAPAGFAVVVTIAGVATSRGEIAPATTPLVVLAAAAGAGLAIGSGRWKAVDRWALIAALGAFAVYAAPVVLSGEPTFSGYIKLDDTATWMAFVDRLMDSGRDLSGLEPSSYLATLEVNLPSGYPVGAFLPLGVGAKLTGADVAWLVQPYMATMGALLASALYGLARPLVESRRLRAVVAFGAAQSALLFAYGLWGGIKELAVALGIALLAALAPIAVRSESGWRDVLPAAVATIALLTIVGSGGLVWILPILGLAALALWRSRGLSRLVALAAPLLLLVVVFGAPALLAADVFSPTQGGLTDASELGNLIGPIDIFQYVGIWPTGDFRFGPINEPLTVLLIGLTIVAALWGAYFAWRRRAWEPLLYLVGAGLGSIAVFVYSSPWVGAKALASGSPSVLLLALAGAAVFAVRVERVFGTTVLVLALAGVLWSNALGYHDVSLAPYEQLRELEGIGEEFAGEGPTLMTEYQPYGVRHFLRAADAEGASELRSRPVPLVEGGEAEKGDWVDTDQILPSAWLTYRTLVLRRSPAQSRPPAAYELVRRGDYYDVWQRKTTAEAPIERLPLGEFYEPAAVPDCAQVRSLAALAGDAGTLTAAERGANVVANLPEGRHPADWAPIEAGSPDLIPHGPGTLRLRVRVPAGGRYELFVQGSVRNPLAISIDGTVVGGVDYQLNAARQFLDLGEARLRAGTHTVELTLDGQSPAPGSGGPPEPIGPLVLSPVGAGDPVVLTVPAADAARLCGRNLDWIEAGR